MQTKILDILRSRSFFLAILALFAIESMWIAFSATYPMVFDENTHLGIIQLYSHRLNPLWFQQPEHAGWAGALTRDPSYLYHYLMSFPYRLIALFTKDTMVQVIFLRLINIGLFGLSLVLFRKLLLRTKVSPAIAHVTLLFFILMPVVPLLAGQINYDNMIMPLAACALLLALNIKEKLSYSRALPWRDVCILATVCMLSSLVQFMFLPLFAGIFLWLAWQFAQVIRRRKTTIRSSVFGSWLTNSWKQTLLVVFPFLIALGLFLQMYGVNVVRYHNLTPQCHQVMSRAECSEFGPWQRNQEVLARKHTVNSNPILYFASWLYRLCVALFFTSSGGAAPSAFYLSINPLPVIFLTALAVLGSGGILLLCYRNKVFRDYEYIGFFLFISILYAGSLWLRNYHDYIQLGEKIAIQGRYLFPIAIPSMIIVALAFRQLLGSRAHLKMALMAAVFVLFLQGGGALTYIVSSNEAWYWDNHSISKLNATVQKIVNPLIVIKTPMRSIGSSNTLPAAVAAKPVSQQ